MGKHRLVRPRALTQKAVQLAWHMASSFIQHAKVFSPPMSLSPSPAANVEWLIALLIFFYYTPSNTHRLVPPPLATHPTTKGFWLYGTNTLKTPGAQLSLACTLRSELHGAVLSAPFLNTGRAGVEPDGQQQGPRPRLEYHTHTASVKLLCLLACLCAHKLLKKSPCLMWGMTSV